MGGFLPIGGVGGGGGLDALVLGLEPNTFATNAARNTQAASDATWLNTYDTNRNSIVRVGTDPTYTYYRRPSSPTGTDDWEDVTTIVTGPPGQDGMGAIDQTIPVGTMLAVALDGSTRVAGRSSLLQTGMMLEINTDTATQKSSMLGNIMSTTDGFGVIGTNMNDGTYYDPPGRAWTETGGSQDLRVQRRSPAQLVAFQDRSNEDIDMTTSLTFNIRNIFTSTIFDFRSLADAANSGSFYMQIYRGTTVDDDQLWWQSHTQQQIDAGNVFTVDGGNLIHDLRPIPNEAADLARRSAPVALLANSDYTVRLTAVNGTVNIKGTISTQDDVNDPNSILSVAGQEVPYFMTTFIAYTLDKVLTDQDITSLGSGQIITTAERTKLGNLTAFFRGNFSTTATYQHGDIVRSNYQGRPAMFVAAAALLPSTTLPEARLDTGFWFLLTDRTWRGNWAASDFIPGQMVSHNGEVWVAVQIIGVGDTNPPSSTNTSWEQISGGGAGTFVLPTVYRRSTTTIDVTMLSRRVEFDGSSGNATFTVPNTSTTGFANGSLTYIDNTSSSNTVTLAAGSGVTITGQTSVTSGQFVFLIWEAVEGSNDILRVYLINSTGTGGTGAGPYSDYRTHNSSVTLTSTQVGVNAYIGTADATFTLPSGLGATDDWTSFVDNRSTAGTLTIAGGVAPVVLESGQGSVIYWSGTDFVQGAIKTRSNVTQFPDHPNNPIQASTSYTFRGSTYTTGANGITYGNSDARGVFLNTHLRMQTSSTYIHDLPELSLIDDAEGFTITKNSSSADQLIRPFSGATITFGSTTFTFSNPLRLTSGTATVVKTGSQSWLVTMLTGTFIGGTSSGGSGQSQSDQFSGQFFNEIGAAVEAGDGVHLQGEDGNQSFVATSLAADGLLSGFAQEDIVANQSGQIARDGPINMPKIRIATGIQIGAPLTSGDPLYWYPGGVGLTPGYLTLDEDEGANIQAATVITSEWPFSTQEFTSTDATNSADVKIDLDTNELYIVSGR